MFKASVVTANKELSKREKVMLCDTSDAERIDQAIADGALILHPSVWAELHIEAGDKEYPNYVVVDADTGMKYVTGSLNFWNAFMSIADAMEGEDFSVKVYGKPSKNYSGKNFITCSLI
jgi:hypothetical protein